MTIKKHNNIAQYIAKQISKQSFSLIRADVLQANVDLTKKDLQHFFERLLIYKSGFFTFELDKS
ncbi:MAG: hypothetical protein ACKPE2_22510 [Dolichospermum sp.]|jgi:hypothetical protein